MSVVRPDDFPAPAYTFQIATGRQREAAHALRRQVFCTEQQIFYVDDRDALDDVALPLVALDSEGRVVGTVRIHEESPGLWWGSRLAVAASHRRAARLGEGLIRLAVSTANARGGARFLARVQAQNAPLFLRLHWEVLEEVTLHNRPHLKMEADMAWYPNLPHPDMTLAALIGAGR